MKTLYYTLALSFLACSIILNICQYRQRENYVNPAEYQFIVTDDSITVKDFGKKWVQLKLKVN